MFCAFQLREEERLRQVAGSQGGGDTDRERARQRALQRVQRVHERQAGLRGRGTPLSKGSLREGNKPGPEQGQEARMQESDDLLSTLLEQQTLSEMRRNGRSNGDGQQEVEAGVSDIAAVQARMVERERERERMWREREKTQAERAKMQREREQVQEPRRP